MQVNAATLAQKKKIKYIYCGKFVLSVRSMKKILPSNWHY